MSLPGALFSIFAIIPVRVQWVRIDVMTCGSQREYRNAYNASLISVLL
jgi:hypothetical protein